MHIFDPKFKTRCHKYFLQCAVLSAAILLSLLFLDVLAYPALITCLGATFFTMFIVPNTYTADPRRLLGGYAIGITMGIVFHTIMNIPYMTELFPLTPHTQIILYGTIAVGTAGFFMTLTNTEHPPAVGVSLGLVINEWDWTTIGFLVTVVLVFTIVKLILKPIMIDLIDMNS